MQNKLFITLACVIAALATMAQTSSPAAEGLAKLKSLQGEWIDVDGVFGEKGKVAVTYRVTGGGSTVVETFPVGTPHEMVTVYHLDGGKLVLTHYCTSNTQPRMQSTGLANNALTFDFIGGSNIDPATTSHMHGARIEFVSADEIRGTWTNWSNGKPAPHATFRVVRRK